MFKCTTETQMRVMSLTSCINPTRRHELYLEVDDGNDDGNDDAVFFVQVILCTDGRANIGLGQVEQLQSNSLLSPHETNFYRQLSAQAVDRG